jgi:hypothetical protein
MDTVPLCPHCVMAEGSFAMTIFFMTTGFSFGSELRSGRAWP